MDVHSSTKLAEGGFNRVFEVTMKDGLQIIARIPYRTTQPHRLAVASEAATINLIRRHGVPAPEVLGYSCDSSNPVGTEYILMQKLSGSPLADTWFKLSEVQQTRVMSSIVDAEACLATIDLPANGSIFYAKDVPEGIETRALSDAGHAVHGSYCVGPDVSLMHWSQKRSMLDIPRQPCVLRY